MTSSLKLDLAIPETHIRRARPNPFFFIAVLRQGLKYPKLASNFVAKDDLELPIPYWGLNPEPRTHNKQGLCLLNHSPSLSIFFF